jgi:hypothetical protein
MDGMIVPAPLTREDAVVAALHLRQQADAADRVAKEGDKDGAPWDAWSLGYFDRTARAFRAAADHLMAATNVHAAQ